MGMELLWILLIVEIFLLNIVGARRFTVECSSRPYFRCPDCLKELLEEQNTVAQAILQQYPKAFVAETSHKLLNAIFVDNLPEEEAEGFGQDTATYLQSIPGVLQVYFSEDLGTLQTEVDFNVDNDDGEDGDDDSMMMMYKHSQLLTLIGADVAALEHCLSGNNVKVAILDSGIDYTHESLGGAGTVEAFQAAYGANTGDARNTRRDGLFPTDRVVEGYDFLGDEFREGDPDLYAMPDHDPVDLSGHGTAVSHAVRAVAPNAQLVAVKICSTFGRSTCPDFAYIKGLEYVLDPNQDGKLDDAVDVVNISLGRLYASSYYSVLAKATEEIFALGVLPVLAAGNEGNVPFILGGAPASPNSLTVGATVVDYNSNSNNSTTRDRPNISSYSSRGPGSDGNLLKPDLVAPGGPYRLAEASTGNQYRRVLGTSFAAPLVAGSAALLKEKCPQCSPFAIKALLMNHAHHDIRYGLSDSNTAPVTLQGAGLAQLHRSLAATFWAYSEEDFNPSLSLGLVNAASNLVLKRRIRITKLSDQSETLAMSYELRSQQHAPAISVQFTPEKLVMEGDCQDEYYFDVQFRIDASKAPSNHQCSGGPTCNDPATLDWNELDGWLRLHSETLHNNDVGLPFHMILRKASNVTLDTTSLDDTTLFMSPTSLPVNLHNSGAETAQIDAFELIAVSQDDHEKDYGVANPPADIRYFGYRILLVNDTDCGSMIEFAIHTWEAQRTLAFTHFDVWFDLNFDEMPEFSLLNSGFRLGAARTEMRLVEFEDSSTLQCTGYTPDHGTNTANTVLRVCSSDLGLQENGDINVKVSSYTFPNKQEISDNVGWQRISISKAAMRAPSYDLEPGASLSTISVSGTGRTPNGLEPLGLLLFTNSFRSISKTGAATRESEALVIIRNGIALPLEATPDTLNFPVVQDLVGPDCSWSATSSAAQSGCPGRRQLSRLWHLLHPILEEREMDAIQVDEQVVTRYLRRSPLCTKTEIPRVETTVVEDTPATQPTAAPTYVATSKPTFALIKDDRELDDDELTSTAPPLPINERFFTTSSARRSTPIEHYFILSSMVGLLMSLFLR